MNWGKWKARLKFTVAVSLLFLFMVILGFGGVIQSMDILPEFDEDIDTELKNINAGVSGFQENVTVTGATTEGEIAVEFEGGANGTTPLTGVRIVNTVDDPNEFGVEDSDRGRTCISQVASERDEFVEEEIVREKAYYSLPSFDNETDDVKSFSFIMQANQWESKEEAPEDPVYISILLLEQGYAVPDNIEDVKDVEDSDGEAQAVDAIKKAQDEEKGVWRCPSAN